MHKMPSPAERPDLYDDLDLPDRPDGWVNPVTVDIPERIDQLTGRGEDRGLLRTEGATRDLAPWTGGGRRGGRSS